MPLPQNSVQLLNPSRGSFCSHMQDAYADRAWAFVEIKALVVGESKKSGGVADLCGLINMP